METTKTNFFTQLAQMDIVGNLTLTIAKTTEENMIVSILLDNESCGDNAKKMIPRLNIKGTYTELDEGFFKSIYHPIEKASGLMVEMESFLKQLEIAKQASAMEKEKTDKEKKEREAKEKKYNDIMKKADEFAKAGNYRKAWMTLPQLAEYPEHAETIKKRQSEFSAKFSPDLFQTETEEMDNCETLNRNTEGLFPDHHSDEIEEQMEWDEIENEENY